MVLWRSRQPWSLLLLIVLDLLNLSKIKTVCVLGNHDLYLLRLMGENLKNSSDLGIKTLLEAPDKNELIDWLRHRPLVHVSGKYILVHAGIYPTWDTDTIKNYRAK